MRLITFETPIGNIGCMYTDYSEPANTLHNIFPFLKACKIQLDLQVEIQQEQVQMNVLYLPITEEPDENGMDGKPILAEFEAIGDSLQRQTELNLKAEKMLQETIEKMERAGEPTLIPIEDEPTNL